LRFPNRDLFQRLSLNRPAEGDVIGVTVSGLASFRSSAPNK
jgi:hypothetical protein